MAKAAKEARPRLDADGIRQLLRLRYPDNRYALFDEVRNGAGFNADRSADVLVMALWPSDGLRLTGIEVKVSRSDYKRELERPEKAEAFASYCDYWYIAVEQNVLPRIMDADDLSMVPERWGILQVTKDGDTLRQLRAATLNPEPLPLDRSFIAAICKRAQQSAAPRQQLKDAEKKGREDGQWRVKRVEDERDGLAARIAEFERASGVDINRYGGAVEIGEAVAAVLRVRGDAKYNLRGKIDDVERLLRVLNELHGIIDEIAQPVIAPTGGNDAAK